MKQPIQLLENRRNEIQDFLDNNKLSPREYKTMASLIAEYNSAIHTLNSLK